MQPGGRAWSHSVQERRARFLPSSGHRSSPPRTCISDIAARNPAGVKGPLCAKFHREDPWNSVFTIIARCCDLALHPVSPKTAALVRELGRDIYKKK
jgi:hypothetical protein